jgi:hypothetical protein
MFGKASVEAMALGIPVIIRRDEPIKGQRGNAPIFIVPNTAELKNRIIELDKNRELLRRASEKGRAYVETFHDRNKVACELANYIYSAVKGSPIDHYVTPYEDRYSIFDTNFYQQALPILVELGDVQRAFETCKSGVDNQVSLGTCYEYLAYLLKKDMLKINASPR